MTFGTVTVLTVAGILTTQGCRQVSNSNVDHLPASSVWLIPVDQIHDGGPGKDGIPALSNPDFIKPEFATYLSDDDLVLGIIVDGEVRAYSHPILDWHEIVNDVVGGTTVSITYCPLTGSGIAWDRSFSGSKTTFGVSGLLYNSNLIPFDRRTGSHWSQMKLQCVNGPLIGQYAQTHKILETTWKTWKELYPQTSVLSSNTGYARPYGTYPYGDYKDSDQLFFPISNDDSRLPRKERTLAVISDGRVRAYPLSSFSQEIGVVNETFGGTSIVVVGSRGKNFVVAFESTVNDQTLVFSPVQHELPVVLVDQEGTKWDLLGRALEGPRKGEELKPTRSFISYWFALSAFYPGVEIYRNDEG
ncbi:MAG: DUF3179 domain-containing protein [Bacteroidota bacterium]